MTSRGHKLVALALQKGQNFNIKTENDLNKDVNEEIDSSTEKEFTELNTSTFSDHSSTDVDMEYNFETSNEPRTTPTKIDFLTTTKKFNNIFFSETDLQYNLDTSSETENKSNESSVTIIDSSVEYESNNQNKNMFKANSLTEFDIQYTKSSTGNTINLTEFNPLYNVVDPNLDTLTEPENKSNETSMTVINFSVEYESINQNKSMFKANSLTEFDIQYTDSSIRNKINLTEFNPLYNVFDTNLDTSTEPENKSNETSMSVINSSVENDSINQNKNMFSVNSFIEFNNQYINSSTRNKINPTEFNSLYNVETSTMLDLRINDTDEFCTELYEKKINEVNTWESKSSDDTNSDDDDNMDKDFNVLDCTSESDNSNLSFIADIDQIIVKSLSEKIARKKKEEKKVVKCKYCETDIASKNFMRHLMRNHRNEDEIQKLLEYPKKSKERRQALHLFRNSINFDLYIQGITRPNRKQNNVNNAEYYPCTYCKGLFLKQYLRRHKRTCICQKNLENRKGLRNKYISNSQTLAACAMDPTNVISKLNVKKQVFDKMKGDKIAYEAKKDLLIAHFGESYLKKHKRERMTYPCSTRMRELSRLLISFRSISNNDTITFKDILYPKKFDTVLLAVREIAGYNPETKTFKSLSLAMHLGTSLKLACDESLHLILTESIGLVETRWTTEVASLANKDLQEKRWNKPLLFPLVSDVYKFRNEVMKMAEECKQKLQYDNKNETAYKLLVQCTLSLLIVFNRRRIGDVQYLKIIDYQNENRSNLKDFENVITEAEKVLTTKYKRVVNSGKGSRAVVILVPELLQQNITVLLNNRENYIDKENEYVFAMPGSTIKWGKGDVAIRTLCNKIKLEHPETISSNKLRKHIATVMQLLNLTKDEAKQFANFMGHTEKTHNEFYELPVDIYQTAKVSKLLLMMERGTLPVEYKGKSLSEINLDPNLEYAEEEEEISLGTGIVNLEPDYELPPNNIHVNDPEEYNMNEVNENQKRNTNFIDFDDFEVMNGTNKENLVQPSGNRQRWSKEETRLVSEKFKSNILKSIYPSTDEILKFIDQTKIKRTAIIIKSKLQHLIKLQKKKQ